MFSLSEKLLYGVVLVPVWKDRILDGFDAQLVMTAAPAGSGGA